MPSPPRVLVVDDDHASRNSVAVGLEREGFVVCEASDAREGMRVARSTLPDVAVLDISLGRGSQGFELAERLGAETTIPIVFTGGRAELADRLAAFRVGADDYIQEPCHLRELVARLNAILRRSRRDDVIRVGDLTVDVAGHRASRADSALPLTRVEFELLVALCRTPGRVNSKASLLREVWNYEYYDPNLVEVHLSALRRKLEAFGPRIIHTVRGSGYVIHEP